LLCSHFPTILGIYGWLCWNPRRLLHAIIMRQIMAFGAWAEVSERHTLFLLFLYTVYKTYNFYFFFFFFLRWQSWKRGIKRRMTRKFTTVHSSYN
jgi:hypothetical protein